MTNNDLEAYEILRSIRRILRKVSQHSRQLSRDAGLTVPQLLCMQAIQELEIDGETTVGEISSRVRLSPATVSRILDRLEKAGYALRERRSKDRRKVTLLLTEDGRERLDALPVPLHEQFLERLESRTKEDRVRLLNALEEIVEMMEAADMRAIPVLAPDSSEE